jgi:hypothetical protein
MLGLFLLQYESSTSSDEKAIYYLAGTMSCISVILFIPLLFIILFHIKYICNNETTSENLRRIPQVRNIFDNGMRKNCHDFFNNLFEYKNEIKYSDQANIYLKRSTLVQNDSNYSENRVDVQKTDVHKNKDLDASVSSKRTGDMLVEENS